MNILGNIQNGHKLIEQKEWFIMCSYKSENESQHDYKIVKYPKLLFYVLNVHCGYPSLL